MLELHTEAVPERKLVLTGKCGSITSIHTASTIGR